MHHLLPRDDDDDEDDSPPPPKVYVCTADSTRAHIQITALMKCIKLSLNFGRAKTDDAAGGHNDDDDVNNIAVG